MQKDVRIAEQTLYGEFDKAAKKITNRFNIKLIYLDAVREAVKLCKKHNLNVLEIACNQPVYAADLLKFKDELKNILKVDEVTLHSPTRDINLAAFHPKLMQVSIEEYKLNIDLAAYLGIKKIVLHPGTFNSLHKRLAFVVRKKVQNNFLILNEYAKPKGVMLCVENLAKDMTLYHEPKEMKFFAKHGYLTLDTGHAITNNIDPYIKLNIISKIEQSGNF